MHSLYQPVKPNSKIIDVHSFKIHNKVGGGGLAGLGERVKGHKD